MARVLVMGTGGVGGYFGAAMQAGGHDVAFCARGRNLEALRTAGLRITGARGDLVLEQVVATDRPAETGGRDLVLLTVKTYDLDEAVEAIRPCGAIVLTLQNGVEAPERVRRALGDVVLAGTTGIVADLAAPGHVEVVSSYARIRFGEPDGSGLTDRVAAVGQWLARGSRIEAVPEIDVRVALWSKLALICAMAGLTTLRREPIGSVLGAERDTFRRVLEEVEAVARAKGVGLPEDFVPERLAYADSVDPLATSSMLRDLERGKRLELESLNGSVVRLGRELGVPVPANERIVEGIRAYITPS